MNAEESFIAVNLGDIADFRNGKALSPEMYSPIGKHPVFGSNGQIARSDEVLCSKSVIVIGRVGAYCGSVHHVPRSSWVTDNAIIAVPKEGNDLRYLYYLLGSLDLQRTAIGSAQPLMTQSGLKVVKTKAPPLSEQRAIASVLGALDDKIEVNRRMNATLEAMARALFQSWFVDFDPVRAKSEGRHPEGMDADTAALFPAEFEDSELGMIPKGWTIQPVGEIVECVGGGTPSTAEPQYWEGGTHHWTTPKDFSSLQAPILLNTERRLTPAGISKISSGLLPIGTLLMSSRAPVGYLAISAIAVAINQGFIALKCNERASNYFMLNWCQQNMTEIEGRATGTTFAEISKQNFRPIKVVLPPTEIMATFTTQVAPLYAQITANLRESRTLAALRDTLLPKLLSGELRVNDALQTLAPAI